MAGYDPRQRWKANDGALRTRINAGDFFRYIGRNPSREATGFDLTGSELLRLDSRGVSYEEFSRADVYKVIGRS